MNLCITLADVPGSPDGDLDSLHRWLCADSGLFTGLRLERRPAPGQSAPVAHELIVPLAELAPPGRQALPLAVAVWIQQRRSDLEVGYRIPDGTEMVVRLTPARNPEQVLRHVVEAAGLTVSQQSQPVVPVED
jgi:hypothetical protein